ncbi:preprotein translocase subunit YajC [Staphylococcus aureus]|nr:preprotein translocase subunit YajC [Staphylococcus aureus]QBQ51715.1 preprotein translocase subunit YajC [Staphylococcus aureus]HBG3005326.1 preprotein translocase subunit YajC [Staphylococcus aureus]
MLRTQKTFKQEERIKCNFHYLYIVVIFAVMYFLMIRPQQKRAKQHRELINNIQSGQRITTIGGIKGTVKAVDETTVVITVNGHGTELTFEKPAIKQVDPS